MENIYLIMLVILIGLAIADLVVGVSNDAVNFLNSAVGSRAVSFKAILVVASIGILLGAISSGGMMEVARKGIFNPGAFYFEEIMIVFIAVMITDVLLLDFFNTLGLPTSTTVSIVFNLLGASVAVAYFKIYTTSGDFSQILEYINTSSAILIIIAIFLSVGLAFTVGALVQYFSRIIFTFQFEKKLKYFGALFGGISITAISFYILLKGFKSVSFIPDSFNAFVSENTPMIIVGSFIFWTLFSQALMSFFKVNILKLIIVIGTFSLALAFAGNDLVNFIGVPIAAWHSYELWAASGAAPSEYLMTALAGKVETPTYLLVLSGIIMVLALIFSKKSRHVMQTELKLSRQGQGEERFKPNFLSRAIVRLSIQTSRGFSYLLPAPVWKKIDAKFQKPQHKGKPEDAPMFDMVRASVNLVVASILISIGTSYKLPLSTTYVTFMVAMGSSLADRAWDRESAVYRVAGVFNVIGGWFMTAISALSFSAITAAIIWVGGIWAVIALAAVVVFIMFYSGKKHTKKEKEAQQAANIGTSINEVTSRASQNILTIITAIDRRYGKVIDHLAQEDVKKLKKDTAKIKAVKDEIEDLKRNVYYFIKSLEDDTADAGRFYIHILKYLEQMVESVSKISENAYHHVLNNHKNLLFNQIRDLKSVDNGNKELVNQIKVMLDTQDFNNIDSLIEEGEELSAKATQLFHKQINRVRTTDASPKNSKLYFDILLESEELIRSAQKFLTLFKRYPRASGAHAKPVEASPKEA